MLDALMIRRWHHEFAPFVCRSCGVATAFTIATSSEPRPADGGGGHASHDPFGAELVTLRCDFCEGTTLFPVTRLERIDDIAAAFEAGSSAGLDRLPCSTCSGFGAHQWAPPPWRGGPHGEGPCFECLGAGFVWQRGVGCAQWTYAEILAGLPFPEIA